MNAAGTPTSTVLRILRLPQVCSKIGRAKSSVYALIVADATFPKPIRLGARAVGWVESELDTWLATRIAMSRGSAE